MKYKKKPRVLISLYFCKNKFFVYIKEKNILLMVQGASLLNSLFIGVIAVFGISLSLIFFSRCGSLKNLEEDLLNYHSKRPKNLNYSQATKQKAIETTKRFWQFVENIKKLQAGEGTQFEFTTQDINSLIVYNEYFAEMKDRFRFYIENKTLTAEISFPLDYFAEKLLEERLAMSYLNGKAEFYTYIKSKVFAGDFLFFSLKQFIPDGEKLGLEGLSFLSEQNLFGYLTKSKEEYQLMEWLTDKIYDIKFEGQKIIVLARL